MRTPGSAMVHVEVACYQIITFFVDLKYPEQDERQVDVALCLRLVW